MKKICRGKRDAWVLQNFLNCNNAISMTHVVTFWNWGIGEERSDIETINGIRFIQTQACWSMTLGLGVNLFPQDVCKFQRLNAGVVQNVWDIYKHFVTTDRFNVVSITGADKKRKSREMNLQYGKEFGYTKYATDLSKTPKFISRPSMMDPVMCICRDLGFLDNISLLWDLFLYLLLSSGQHAAAKNCA